MDDLLQGLNAAQKEAVTSTEGYIRVIAGAGSGKTGALTRRFAYLVNQVGILPGNILCVTFTNKAANEMRQRIHQLTGDNDTGYISTFHSFCVSILQEDSHALQYPKNFLVLDNSDIDAMLALIYEERHLTLRHMTFGKARDMIEIRKTFTEPKYYLDMLTMSLEDLKGKYLQATKTEDIIFYGYLYQEKKCFGVDYNDLIKFSLYIFEENEDIRLKWQQRLEYIMIDEFQDIDQLQYRLMEVLCAYHQNLFIVGDPDQTIYTWRGAKISYLLDFDKAFPKAKTIMLLQNYRSTPQIIAAANSLISKNKKRVAKELVPMLSDGPKVHYDHAATSQQEAKLIADHIKELHQQGVPYRSMTILYRAHYVTRNLEEVFLKERLPYTIYSGVQFFGRMEIKDALSYLRLIAYKDDLSFMRVANKPKRNLGQRRMEFLQQTAAEKGCTLYDALKASLENDIFKGTKAAQLVELVEDFNAHYQERPISEVMSALMDKSQYEKLLRTEGSQERLDNLAELKQAIYEYETTCGEETTLEHYLNHIALFTNSDTADTRDRVKLMTVHTAKGLEFPYVFLCALNEGLFPSKKTKTREGMEEERRLAFVAITRAQRGLYLSDAEGLNFDGSLRYLSRFLLDIDAALLDCDQAPLEALREQAAAHIAASDKFLAEATEPAQVLSPGQRVEHAVFGAGTILAVDTAKGAYSIQFDTIATPRSIACRVKLKGLPK